MFEDSVKKYGSNYDEYLKDESKFSGSFDSISFPKDIEEIKQILGEMEKNKIPVTIQGSMTGICGGAVPVKGHAMNMTRFTKIGSVESVDGTSIVSVKCGTVLEELKRELLKHNLFWPPEPTELSSTVGGVIATDAKGISYYHYGDVSNYVSEITVLDISGNETVLMKEDSSFKDYFGSEGMYGLLIECKLIAKNIPEEIWGIGFFFDEELSLLKWADNLKVMELSREDAYIVAAEFIDSVSLDYIYEMKKTSSNLKTLPDIPKGAKGIVYVEIHGYEEEAVLEIAEELMESASEYGSDSEKALAATGRKEIEKLRMLRHAAPESVNNSFGTMKDGKVTEKLGTDIKWENKTVFETVEYYRKSAYERGLEISIFGHVLDSHLHVNILYKNIGEYEAGKQLIFKWSEEAIKDQGNIFTEHGIGKVKRDIYSSLASEDEKDLLKKRKKFHDPENLWNPGNVF